MKIEVLERFLLGLAVAGLMTGCGSVLESPDDWAQAPMPGETSTAASAAEKKKGPESKPEEKPAPEIAKAPEPKAEKPVEPKKEEPAKPKTGKPEKRKLEEPAPPKPAVSASDLKKGEYPTATRVKGFSSFVHSPYNSRWVKVKGIPSGSLVADPRFPVEEKKYFRVP